MLLVLIIGIVIIILFYFAYLDIRHEIYLLERKRDIMKQEFIESEYEEKMYRDIITAFNNGKTIKASGLIKLNDKVENKVLTVTDLNGNIIVLDGKYAVSKSILKHFKWEI